MSRWWSKVGCYSGWWSTSNHSFQVQIRYDTKKLYWIKNFQYKKASAIYLLNWAVYILKFEFVGPLGFHGLPCRS
jgi:hypothetical protein